MDAVVLILAVTILLTMLAMTAAFWFMFKSQEKHLLSVLDRFLSRNMSEYGMTDLIKKEIEADQEDDRGDEPEEDELFAKYLAERKAAVETLGITEGVE